MSKLNGDRARFQKNRKRRMQLRQRLHALATRLRNRASPATRAASGVMLNEGGPVRAGD